MKELCLVSCSGGLDSTTTLAMLKLAGYENIIACHFDYGCRSGAAEKIAITNICKELDIPLKIFDISKLMKDIDSESMLINPSAAITTGTSDDIKTTCAWVHNRNGLFLNIMAAFAEEQVFKYNYDKVYFLGGFLNLSESGCFIPKDDHTITTFDNKQVKPLDIKVGDEVLSFNFEKKEFEKAIVTNIYHPEHDITYKISLTFDEGIIHSKKVLFLSKEHPLYIKKKGWVEAQNLAIGDMCYTYRECGVAQRTSHIDKDARRHLAELASIRFKGKPHSAELNQKISKAERKLIDLFESLNLDLRYVGDGQIWMTAEGKHMNPDFINISQKKVVEYYGGIGFFHSLEEIEDRDRKYKSIGWDHLAIIESELDNLDEVKNKVLNFMMDVHNGWIIENIERIEEKVEMLNYSVEPNNNFFLNKVLTHNTYPDNSEYFISSFLEFMKYATLIGNRIEPCYGLSDLMKFEQFALIKEFHLEHAYRHAISCDRAKVIDGVPCNCMKNGVPACGSGLLSYWGSKMVGMDDTKIRNFYEVDDPDLKILEPEHLNHEPEKYDIHSIINRIHFPNDKLYNLHRLVNEKKQKV